MATDPKPTSPRPVKPLRVLIVEDSPDDEMFLLRALRQGGYDPVWERVQTSETMEEALQRAKWDIIISDYAMPHFTGLQALRLMKKLGYDLPFIIVSGTIGEETAVEAMREGAHDYLMKGHLVRLAPAVERELREAKERQARRETEQSLRDSEQRFRSLSASSPVGIFLADVRGMLIYANPRCRDITGLTLMEMMGDGWARSIHSEDRQRVLHEWFDCVRDGLEYSIEYRVVTSRGDLRWVHGRCSQMFSDEHEMQGHVGTIEDITERKNSEEALRASEERYRNLIETAQDVIFTLSAQATLQSLNAAFETITGRKTADWIGEPFSALIHHDDLSVAQEMFARVLHGDKPPTFELRVLHKDGRMINGEFTVAPQIHEGMVVGVFGIARDVTERKLLEAQLMQSQKVEAIGQLAGGVAHDFNNLLTAILGYTTLLLKRLGADNAAKRNAEEIQRSAERAVGLTRQLLAFSRKEALELKIISLNTIVTDMENMLRQLTGEQIRLVTRYDRELGSVRADGGQIGQVVMNLAVNARDAMAEMPKGTLTIETANVTLDEAYARVHHGVRPGPHILLAVSDTGTGMPDEVKQHIFEPFFTTKPKGVGTGLGLPTCYNIVKQCGGHIQLETRVGRGTTFHIYLPRVEGKPEALPTEQPPQPEARRGTETVLLVEDEPVVRELTRQVLGELGYTVVEADNGHAALRLGTQNGRPIHLLISDLMMPEMGGKELAERLRVVRPTVKVLFTSGYNESSVIPKGLPNNIWFLQKPFSVAVLANKVREVLDA